MQLTDNKLMKVLAVNDFATPEIFSVRIYDTQIVSPGQQEIIKVSGDFYWKLSGVERQKSKNQFRLFLERGNQGESWRLASPITSGTGALESWETYPLSIE